MVDDEKQSPEDIHKQIEEKKVLINLLADHHTITHDLYSNVADTQSRMLALFDTEPELFSNDSALSENLEEMKERMGKMEQILKEAAGFHITSSYGTDLKIGMRPFKDRRWFKETGEISQAGQWDNLPAGEVFTTPDESNAEGILVLPALDTEVSDEQGVDELIRLTIKQGKIVEIQGGKSAEKLRAYLTARAEEEVKVGSQNPWNVLRIAEIAFGANSKARYLIREEEPDKPAVTTVEAEKKFGTMHLAFGGAKHGEEGVDGYEEAVSHLDFVLPRNGLTVEMFTSDQNFKNGKNGRKIFDNGNVNFN
jgi:leucyl aminopeptidase (aminopeptidase T)